MPQFSAFTAHAPSMSAGRDKMRDFFSNQDPPRSLPYTAPSTTPYLGLRARLSQIWINRWTILLLLVLVRTLIAVADVNDGISSSKREALSACTSVESMGSAMASLPHYMSQGVNAMAASGIENAISALMKTTTLAVTVVEEIVIFVVGIMYSTYICLLHFAVTGSLDALVKVVDAAQDQVKEVTKDVSDGLTTAVKTFTDALDSLRSALGGQTIGYGSLPTIPDASKLTDNLSKLQNFKLSMGDFDTTLKKLNETFPTYDQVKDQMNNFIRPPFESVKTLIDEKLGNYTFDKSMFPVPQKETMSFCDDDDGINGFFNSLVAIASKAKAAFIGILLVGAILACVPMAWREIRRYRTQQQHSQLIREKEHDPMDVVYIVSRPYTAGAGLKFSNAAKSEKRRNLIRWVVAYATTDAALFILSLAIAGLFSCLCQYILLKQLEKEVPGLAAHVGNLADQVVDKLDNASVQWAKGTNGAIMSLNSTINDDLFGWVHTSTAAVNDTLNHFVDEGTKLVNSVFGGTPLEGPIKQVLNCLIGLKVESFQQGLTWIHDHAHINLPLMPNDTFSVGAAASIRGDQPNDQSFLATPGDKAADKISGAVTRFLDKLYSGLQTETIISAAVLMAWIMIVLIGVIRACTLWFKADRSRGNGGDAPMHVPASPMIQNSATDFRSDNQDRYRHFDNIPLSDANRSVVSPPVDRDLPTYNTAVAMKIRSNRHQNESHSYDQGNEEYGNAYSSVRDGQHNSSSPRGKHDSYWGSDVKI